MPSRCRTPEPESSYSGSIAASVQITCLAKPIHRVGKRLAIGPRAKAEVASAGRAEEHVMLGHAQSVDGRKGSRPVKRPSFGGVSDRHGGGVGNAQPRRAPGDKAGDVRRACRQAARLAAENVAPPGWRAEAPRDVRRPRRTTEIELNGVHEAGHAAVRRLDDDAAGRAWATSRG